MAAVRYLVKDVDRSIAFYTGRLDFKLDHRAAPAFASVSKGDRIAVEVADLAATIAELRRNGARFRNEMETGPIELFQPA